jgi:hypothetical protein
MLYKLRNVEKDLQKGIEELYYCGYINKNHVLLFSKL